MSLDDLKKYNKPKAIKKTTTFDCGFFISRDSRMDCLMASLSRTSPTTLCARRVKIFVWSTFVFRERISAQPSA